MANKNFYNVRNVAGSVPEIDILKYIDDDTDGVSYAGFRDTIKSLAKSNTHCVININSGGGNMFEGFAIYDEMQLSPMHITCRVVGMAASMAGVIAVGGDVLEFYENASFMTHKPKGMAMGEATDLESCAEHMNSLEARVVKIFATKTGKKETEIKDWFKPSVDKWFTAKEAETEKIADKVIPALKKFKAPTNAFGKPQDAWKFYNNYTNNNTKNMKKILMVLSTYKVVNTLSDDSSDGEVGAVVENALKERDTKITELQNKLDAQDKLRIDNVLDKAVADAKITAAEKEEYRPVLVANFETGCKMIDKLPGKTDINSSLDKGGKNPTNANATGERKDWTIRDWETKDSSGLAKMRVEKPEDYQKMFDAFYK